MKVCERKFKRSEGPCRYFKNTQVGSVKSKTLPKTVFSGACTFSCPLPDLSVEYQKSLMCWAIFCQVLF